MAENIVMEKERGSEKTDEMVCKFAEKCASVPEGKKSLFEALVTAYLSGMETQAALDNKAV